MYKLTRQIHLFTGLALLSFVLMYFVTGYIMIHEGWFPHGQPSQTITVAALNPKETGAPDKLTALLRQRFGLGGQAQAPQKRADGSWRYRFVAPGGTIEATVKASGESVEIRKSEFGFAGTAQGFHRLHGWEDPGFFTLWAVVYDLASLSMIVFAITGIVLWYKTTRNRVPGWICLAVSFSFAASMILYLLLSA